MDINNNSGYKRVSNELNRHISFLIYHLKQICF